MADKALKLEIPWSSRDAGPLCVEDGYERPLMVDDRQFRGSHVYPSNNAVLVKNFFGVNNRVLDVSRYHIGDDRQPDRHCDVPETRLQIQPQLKSIVLLVESPSVEEYRCGDINFPIAPACGATGENIDRCLGTVLSHIEEQQLIAPGCPVIISNPIQFQANLLTIHGQSTWNNSRMETLRNNVWKALWNEGSVEGCFGYIQLCFRARLNTYDPRLIINACTGDLQSLVTNFVRTELPTAPLYEAYHPAHTSWKSCDGIRLQRIYPQPTKTLTIRRDVQRPGTPK